MKRTLVTDPRVLERALEHLGNSPDIGLDTESSGPYLRFKDKGKRRFINVYRSTLTGLSASSEVESFYFPLRHRTNNLPAFYHGRLRDMLSARRQPVWVHNLKHELVTFRQDEVFYWLADSLAERAHGARPQHWFCTQVLAWLTNAVGANANSPYGLKSLAPSLLGLEMSDFETATGGRNFSELTPEEGLDYACEDAEAALGLGKLLRPTLSPEMVDWYETVETPFVYLLREMTDNGFDIDREAHARTMEGLRAVMREQKALWDFEADGLSIASPQQLAELYSRGIWDPTDVPVGASGKPSTEAEYIRWQLERCPPGTVGHTLAATKLAYATAAKLVNTYGQKLVDIADQYPDGRLHSDLMQTGTATGRLSSSYPNIQNIPKRTEEGKLIRESFVVPEGHRLLSADYSQIELRVLAHLSGSGPLFEGYQRGADVHAETAAALNEALGQELITRDQGKTLNFATIYGAGAARVAKSLSLPLNVTKDALRAHREAHAEVYQLIDRMQEVGRERGWVRTLAGRRRFVDAKRWAEELRRLRSAGETYDSSEDVRTAWALKGREERRASNTPVQGGASDVVKVGMLAAWRTVNGDMIAQIHDDIVFRVRDEDADEAQEALRTALEGAGERFDLRVPLVAEPALSPPGGSWGSLK